MLFRNQHVSYFWQPIRDFKVFQSVFLFFAYNRPTSVFQVFSHRLYSRVRTIWHVNMTWKQPKIYKFGCKCPWLSGSNPSFPSCSFSSASESARPWFCCKSCNGTGCRIPVKRKRVVHIFDMQVLVTSLTLKLKLVTQPSLVLRLCERAWGIST